MYKVGSFVVYGSEGVCKIVEIVENTIQSSLPKLITAGTWPI